MGCGVQRYGQKVPGVSLLLCALLLLVSWPSTKEPSPLFKKDTLVIRTHKGKTLHFIVEIAESQAARMQGLQHRRSLPRDAGMLFLFPREQPISMWMKNTYLPLDMLFIGKDGIIRHIRRDTTPFSLEALSSGVPVLAVLEVNAGTAKAQGIAEGDKVVYAAFSNGQ